MMLLLLIVTIVYLAILGQKLYDVKDIIGFILWIFIGCIAGGLILYNYRFFKKIDKYDTPNQLLSWFKKNRRIEIICAIAVWLALIGDSVVGGDFLSAVGMVIAFIVVLFLTLKNFGQWYRRDKEVIEQLQELAEKE